LGQAPALARLGLVTLLSDAILSRRLPYPTRIAVDGPDAAGKTTLADELAARLRTLGREVVRAPIDGFHRPRATRYRRGRLSPEGYYEDSFDLDALQELLLGPLGPEGSGEYRSEAFDYLTDSPIVKPVSRASRDAVLVFDGVFLLRPELASSWDLRIYLHVAEDEILRRARRRDSVALLRRLRSTAATGGATCPPSGCTRRVSDRPRSPTSSLQTTTRPRRFSRGPEGLTLGHGPKGHVVCDKSVPRLRQDCLEAPRGRLNPVFLELPRR
jgi:uridine kinase